MLDYTFIKLSQTADSFKVKKKCNTFQVSFAKEAGVINTLEGAVYYLAEDALVTGLSSEVWPISRQHFNSSYSPIPPLVMGKDGEYQSEPIDALALVINENCHVTLQNGNTLTGKKGDFLIQFANNDYAIVAAQLFDKLYEKIIEQNIAVDNINTEANTAHTPNDISAGTDKNTNASNESRSNPQSNNSIHHNFRASSEKSINFDIFVSYSTKDKLFVDAMVNKLENNGIRCWYAPRDIPAGMEWPKAIAMAIRDSTVMMLVFSKYANISQEISRELTLASSHKRPVIPVRIDDVVPSDDLAYHLSNRHWLDVYGQETQKAVESVLEGLTIFASQLPHFNPSLAEKTPEAKPTNGSSTSKPKKMTLIALAIISCLALAGGGYWLLKGDTSRTADELVEFKNIIVHTYKGPQGLHVNLMPYGDIENKIQLVQFTNTNHPYNNHVFECKYEFINNKIAIYTTKIGGRDVKLLTVDTEDNGYFYPPNSTLEVKIKYDSELSKQTDATRIVTQYRQQQPQTTANNNTTNKGNANKNDTSKDSSNTQVTAHTSNTYDPAEDARQIAELTKKDEEKNKQSPTATPTVQDHLKEAKKGNTASMYSVGYMYDIGKGLKQDYQQAMYWYTKAANNGDSSAMNSIGVLYDQGRGIKKDMQLALQWYLKAADLGSASSMYNIGYIYERGEGVEKNLQSAYQWYLKAANKGSAAAMFNIGSFYDQGKVVKQSFQQAIEWYKKAANAGNYAAMHNLGVMHYKGEGVAVNHQQALQWYLKAADNGNGNLKSMYTLGVMYAKGTGTPRDYQQAMDWYLKAAKLNHTAAIYSIGTMYYFAEGVEKDYKQTLQWYLRAADNGDTTAMYNVGFMYKNGQGTAKDNSKAMQWYLKATQNGSADAMNGIAVMYYEGAGVPKDYKKAMQWFLKAAEKGHAQAMKNVGMLYKNGFGVEKNLAKANQWYLKAAEQK